MKTTLFKIDCPKNGIVGTNYVYCCVKVTIPILNGLYKRGYGPHEIIGFTFAQGQISLK